MEPRKIERTLEFIVDQQAQTAVHIQRLVERQDKTESMLVLMTELAEVQSQRLDRHDEIFKDMQSSQRESLSLQRESLSLQRETLSLQQETLSLQREALSRLDNLLQRVTRDR
jgi:hypothetical protein